jgi:trigger factor
LTVEIVEVSSCKRNLAVEVPTQEVDQEVETVAREYARKVKVPGFRPGKVPLNIIKQRYGPDLLKDATQNIIERAWKGALTDHDLHPLAPPEVKNVENKPGSPMKFTVAFEILPPMEVKDYKDVPVTVPSSEITDETVDRALQNLRERNAQFVPVDGEACDGHYLTVTVDGQFEGESKANHEDDVTLVIGDAQTNADFSANLRGTRVGESRTFDVTYPEDYQRKQFAGKKVQYTILVKDIKEKQLADLNDEFAQDIGSESLEGLRNKIRDELVTRAKQDAEKKAREALLDSIIQRQTQTVEVPECMVEEELDTQARRLASSLAYQGIDINQTAIDWKKVLDEQKPQAEQAVRRTIFLDAIARQEGIEVTKEEVDSELEKLAEGTSKSAVALRAQLEKEERIQGFEQHLRQNKALDFIYRNANISVG